jgi:hypothetical protein
MNTLLKNTIEQDIKSIFKGFHHAEKGGFIYNSLLKWCDVIEEILNNSEMSLNAESGELWQQIQDFRED